MGTVTEWPSRYRSKKTSRKCFKVQPSMLEAIDSLLPHLDEEVDTPSEFIRRSVRREARAGRTELYKDQVSPVIEKCSSVFFVKEWQEHFPTDAKIVKAIAWARIKEEQVKLGIAK